MLQGIALNEGEKPRLVRDLGSNTYLAIVAIGLRNVMAKICIYGAGWFYWLLIEPAFEGRAFTTRLPDLPRHGSERNARASETSRHTAGQIDVASCHLDAPSCLRTRCIVRTTGPRDADDRSARALVNVGGPGGGTHHGNRLDKWRSHTPRPTPWAKGAGERTALRARARSRTKQRATTMVGRSTAGPDASCSRCVS